MRKRDDVFATLPARFIAIYPPELFTLFYAPPAACNFTLREHFLLLRRRRFKY